VITCTYVHTVRDVVMVDSGDDLATSRSAVRWQRGDHVEPARPFLILDPDHSGENTEVACEAARATLPSHVNSHAYTHTYTHTHTYHP